MSRYLSFASVIFLFFIVSCQKEVSFEQGSPSKGSLQDSVGDCLSKTVTGNYIVAKALNDSNFIDVTVNVTQAGRYTIYTDTVNGYSFRATGNFSSIGQSTVRLKGSGTPQAAGSDDFTIIYDSSFCSVTITVLPAGSSGGGTTSTDHFIITDNSWWSYSTPLTGDTLKRSIIGTANASGFSYKAMKELDASGQYDDTLYYRKSGNNYYDFNYTDAYTTFYFDNFVVDSILFLKEGLNTGDTWSSAVYTGTVNGKNTKVRYDFKCDNANATVTLNSKTYTNVYQITMKAMVDNGTGYATDVTWVSYYAKGIGLIYQKYDDGAGNAGEFTLRYYQVF